MAYKIRRIRHDELAILIDLYRHLHADDGPLPDESAVAALWAEIQADPQMVIFIAEGPEGQPIASCTLAVIRNLTRGGRPYAIIENVVTHADFRRQGYGAAVLRHALESAWSRGCYKVMLMTGSKREETLRFYENAGFVRGVKTGFIAYPPVVAEGTKTAR